MTLSAVWRRISLRQCRECPKLVPAAQERCKSHGASQTVDAFLDADFVIPTHGGPMALGFMGTAIDAQRIITKFTSPRDPETP